MVLGGSPLLAETSNPLGLQTSGARGPASCRALCTRDGPLLCRGAKEARVCFSSGHLPRGTSWASSGLTGVTGR